MQQEKINLNIITQKASDKAEAFLKSLANHHRLALLCLLVEKPRNVTELVTLSGLGQSSVSQHLKKLKNEGIIDYTRSHRILTYRIVDKDAAQIFLILFNRFCNTPHDEE